MRPLIPGILVSQVRLHSQHAASIHKRANKAILYSLLCNNILDIAANNSLCNSK